MRRRQAKDGLKAKLRILFFALNALDGANALSGIPTNEGFSTQDLLEAIEGSMNNPEVKSSKKDKRTLRKNPAQ